MRVLSDSPSHACGFSLLLPPPSYTAAASILDMDGSPVYDDEDGEPSQSLDLDPSSLKEAGEAEGRTAEVDERADGSDLPLHPFLPCGQPSAWTRSIPVLHDSSGRPWLPDPLD